MQEPHRYAVPLEIGAGGTSMVLQCALCQRNSTNRHLRLTIENRSHFVCSPCAQALAKGHTKLLISQ